MDSLFDVNDKLDGVFEGELMIEMPKRLEVQVEFSWASPTKIANP